MPVVSRAGYDIYHRNFGEGPRQALMLHCSMGHSGAWASVARGFEESFTFTAFDHLSHGRSEAWRESEDYHDDSTAIAESFLGAEPVDLIGHSFGATVALRLAVEHPEQVRSLVLIEPVFFAVARLDDPGHDARHKTEMGEISQAMARGDKEAATKSFLSIWGGGMPWEALPEDARKMMMGQIHLILATEPTLYEDRLGLFEEGGFSALRMPVLLLRGGLSPQDIKTVNDGLAARIEGAKNEVIEGAGHMAPITHPKETTAKLRDFWKL